MNDNLPLGMQMIPGGWPMLAGAFFGFARFALGNEQILDDFKSDTGKDVTSIIASSALDKMIIESTGYDRRIMADFLDWLVVNHWGQFS